MREAAWLEDPDAPAREEEIAASDRLREELDDPSSKHPDVELMRSLRNAVEPRAIEAATHKRVLDSVLPPVAHRRSQALYWIAGGLAAAAGVVLVAQNVDRGGRHTPTASMSDLARPHSTGELFTEPFPKEGKTSQRLDTIVASRGRDLRHNRYAKWGVK